MRCCALIVAAGRGARFGAGDPKQFQTLVDRPMLVWSLEAFQRCPAIDDVLLVVPGPLVQRARELLAPRALHKLVGVCAGGRERVDSVRAGLDALPAGAELVAIHDAARPLVSPALIARVVEAARISKAAIPALPVRDTIKRGPAGGAIAATAAREDLHLAQTPQVFDVGLVRRAHASARRGVTDDAQLVEELGYPVRLVEGEARNFKITVPADLELAESLLRGERQWEVTMCPADPRIGAGYDVHPLVAGRRLVLGGVEIAHPTGLLGHSDADVLCHAASDALLGAAGLGDLGAHFPPDDERWRGACGLDLLARVVELVSSAGHRVANLDTTVICERPKLAPHVSAMRQRLADVLGVDASRVSVKATTSERLGFVGRKEGIAAHATVMLLPARGERDRAEPPK
jgi:2-C-methyl-D-erythritol 4-phosphate cytidylyltransferase / 2-C-methyl-D-erythritol 2,4-cyclodiphosphate synthase